jgi:hypothetical protein
MLRGASDSITPIQKREIEGGGGGDGDDFFPHHISYIKPGPSVSQQCHCFFMTMDDSIH